MLLSPAAGRAVALTARVLPGAAHGLVVPWVPPRGRRRLRGAPWRRSASARGRIALLTRRASWRAPLAVWRARLTGISRAGHPRRGCGSGRSCCPRRGCLRDRTRWCRPRPARWGARAEPLWQSADAVEVRVGTARRRCRDATGQEQERRELPHQSTPPRNFDRKPV